jgi:transposase
MDILTEEQVVALKLAHKQTREKRLADRIKAILYLHYGFSYAEIAKLLLFDEVTIRRYLKQFQEKSIDGLLECRYTGGKSRLTLIQETEVKEFFKEQTPQTAMEAVEHMQKTYEISYSVIGMTKLLHRLGFVYKKPKVIPAKTDREKQETFIKLYQQTKEQLGINDSLYFLDATHPTHNTTLSYGWILKGKANDKYVKTTSGRKRLNLNGALNVNNKTAIVLEEKTINTDATIHLLEAIKQKQKRGKVYMILDNASHHHAKLVRRWMLHHPRFKLIFLPAYSPNLNLIERLWRFFHQKVTYNHYFETFIEFKETTLTFFKNLNQYEKELATLLTDNFQLFPSQKLQS